MSYRKPIGSTARKICAYTSVGTMSTSLFFSCLTIKERIIAMWLIETHTLTISVKRIHPCNVWMDSSQRDIFLHRLSQYPVHKHFRFSDYSEAIRITEHWARMSICYVTLLKTLLKPIYGHRAETISEAYLHWHAADQEGKYQQELEIAECWESCFCHGNAIRAYQQACELTDNPGQRECCLRAIAKIKHDMMVVY